MRLDDDGDADERALPCTTLPDLTAVKDIAAQREEKSNLNIASTAGKAVSSAYIEEQRRARHTREPRW